MRSKKLQKAITVTTILEHQQHEQLRNLAFSQRKPMAELIREAVDGFLEKTAKEKKTSDQKK